MPKLNRHVPVLVQNREAMVPTLFAQQPETIRKGLPASAFTNLVETLELTPTQLAGIVGLAPRTLKRRLAEGEFKPTESDRIARVGRIVALAHETFEQNQEVALEWLKESHVLLSNEAPLTALDTEIGVRAVEDILNAIRYGFAA